MAVGQSLAADQSSGLGKVRPEAAEMSTLFRADDTRTTDSGALVSVGAGQVDAASLYLTNGVFLYRVVGMAGSATDDMVALEDCYGLDVVLVPIQDVRARRLRVVTPARIVS